MPMYENPNLGTSIVEGVGDSPSVYVESGTTFLGNQEQHDKLTDITKVNPPMLRRLTSGLVKTGVIDTTTNKVEFTMGHGIDIDNCLIRTADKTAFSGLAPAAGERVTAWGIVQWFDSDTAGSQRFFYITGDGADDATGQCVITFGAKTTISGYSGGASSDINAAGAGSHLVESTKGVITFAYTGADPVRASIELIFDPLSRGNYATMGRSRNVMTSAVFSYVRTYVEAGDITGNPDKYGEATAGAIKSEKVFPSGSQPGDDAKITYFYYKNENPTGSPSHELQQIVKVLPEDLEP